MNRAAFVIAFQLGREVTHSVEQVAGSLGGHAASSFAPHRLAAPNPTIR